MIIDTVTAPRGRRTPEALAMMATPIGELRLTATDAGLVGVYFPESRSAGPAPARPAPDHPVLRRTITELEEYFAGERHEFTVPLVPRGTAFQTKVWTALTAIPYGETCSYGAIARVIGAPSAVRAVGAANGRNPLPIIVPCHRVIGANGTLTGFGGGLPTKRWLLDHELRHRAPA